MSVTEKLLRLFRVDQQIRGLKSRVDSAERYLKQQDAQLEQLNAKREALIIQARQLEAAVHNNEAEMGALDARIATLRDKLNAATSNKEYTALLTDVNTQKADKGEIEERSLEALTQLDDVRAAQNEVEEQLAERGKIREVALADRDTRAAEVKDRLEELQGERKEAASDVPADTMQVFEYETNRLGGEAMAAIEEHSRRHMEFSCGACQVLQPMETISTLLGATAPVTQCVSCGAILYVEEALRESMTSSKR